MQQQVMDQVVEARESTLIRLIKDVLFYAQPHVRQHTGPDDAFIQFPVRVDHVKRLLAAVDNADISDARQSMATIQITRRRGRPPGSKNKPKQVNAATTATPMAKAS